MSLGIGESAGVQFARVERWQHRMELIRKGEILPFGPQDDLLDYTLSFFMNCHHLKDWLGQDRVWQAGREITTEEAKTAVEQFINENEALRICADLCNGTKHLTHNSGRSGREPKLGISHTRFTFDGEKTMQQQEIHLDTSLGMVNALALSKECLELWRAFMRMNKQDLQGLATRFVKIRPKS